MCSTNDGEQQPAQALWANLRQPGPFGWKLRRALANTAIKVVRRQSCCGHDGEPGC
jgi:hypothetical protein